MRRKRSPRFIATILFVRATRAFMRLLRRKGTHFPGQLAKRLCPDFLSRIEPPDKIIAITGTNGKTTTANLVADVARGLGLDFAHNAYGSNIEEGIITTLLDATTLTGKKKKPLAILEVDERLTRIIFKDIVPDIVLVTNLFRESYWRNGHSEFVFGILDEFIPKDCHVIVNADDLLSHQLADRRSSTAFSIAPLPEEPPFTHNLIRDVRLCPRCAHPLTDTFIRYHHMGRAHCDACGWTPIDADFTVISLDDLEDRPVRHDALLDARFMTVEGPDGVERYPFIGDNILDAYNELSAIALFRHLGYPVERIAHELARCTMGASRKHIATIGDTTVIRMLAKAKNPISLTRVVRAILDRPGTKQFVLLIDCSTDTMSEEDNTAWLYDAELTLFDRPDVTRVILGGKRSEDMHAALLLAGVPESKLIVCRNEHDTARHIRTDDGPTTIAVLYELYSYAAAQSVADVTEQALAEEIHHED